MYNFLIILKFRRLDGSLRLDRLGKKLLIVQYKFNNTCSALQVCHLNLVFVCTIQSNVSLVTKAYILTNFASWSNG